ncbi:uncharacterized protein LOC143208387 [Lasioglossum baleicum]|uniref:uncharacterized protein LOC143208387 n=1 Tax=Lasioglossum baleicum TaxID=434251 RepID=UPI003FCEC95D
MPSNGKKDEVLNRTYISPRNKYKSQKERLWKVKFAKLLINDLKNYGPANILYMEALSIVIGRPIRVWLPGRCTKLYKVINGARMNENTTAVDVEFHNCKSTCRKFGHWTLLGNKDPVNDKLHLNGCLFDVISAQTGSGTTDLRNRTVDYLKNNINALINQIDDTLSSNDQNGTTLMVGGARYHGASPRAAQIILDQSQNVYCHGCRQKGHPRGHASDTSATGPSDSVENYSSSTGSQKSGFLSRADQDIIADYALRHRAAQNAMDRLNSGNQNEAVEINSRDLMIAGCQVTQMKEWCNGSACSDLLKIVHVQLVLRHHQNKYNEPEADVFVHTLYPKSR